MGDEGERNAGWPAATGRQSSWSYRLFSSSRYFAAFAVLGSFLAAITLYIYGAAVVVTTIWETLAKSRRPTVEGMQFLQVEFIEMTDVFLMGTVLFIISFGLFQLFIQPDLPVPPWLKIRSLDQLSGRLIEVVGVLLSVTFLAFTVKQVIPPPPPENGEEAGAVAAEAASAVSMLELGISVAIVIAALSLLLVVSHRHAGGHAPAESE
jgi:uncharacterized membrane protein YqhA